MLRRVAALCLSFSVLVSAAPSALAQAAPESTDRAVRIIDDPEAPSGGGSAPAPSRLPDLGAIKIENPAGLAIDVVPGPELNIGSKVSFRVRSRRAGYLILVSVDASGQLTQIFPNPRSLWASEGRPNPNQLRAGRTMTIPDSLNPFAGFEFIAAPPAGIAMIVGILSDSPVQILDLPDVPQQFAGGADALEYLAKATRDLRIAQSDDRLQKPQWSFDAKFYMIR